MTPLRRQWLADRFRLAGHEGPGQEGTRPSLCHGGPNLEVGLGESSLEKMIDGGAQ
jgi:hypothetical protein